jgi:hypothetical protein
MTDINIGFGKVVRIRFLKAARGRRFAPKVETKEALQIRDEKARDLLERRRAIRCAGVPTDLIEKEITRLGYVWVDEPDVDDGRYSYWRRK